MYKKETPILFLEHETQFIAIRVFLILVHISNNNTLYFPFFTWNTENNKAIIEIGFFK